MIKENIKDVLVIGVVIVLLAWLGYTAAKVEGLIVDSREGEIVIMTNELDQYALFIRHAGYWIHYEDLPEMPATHDEAYGCKPGSVVWDTREDAYAHLLELHKTKEIGRKSDSWTEITKENEQ